MSEYSVTARLIEEPQERDRIVPAGFFVRLMARALDVIIIIAVINLFYYIDTFGGTRGWWPPMPIPGETLPTADTFMSTVNILRGIFYMGIHPLYYIILHGMGGQTLGKMAFKLRVVDPGGGYITMGQSTIRWFGYLLCDITLGIGYLVIIFSARKQGLHDKIAGTLVAHQR